LQTEYRDEAGIEAPPPVEERKKRVIIKRKDDVLKGDLFKNLWEKISQKAKYIVNLDVESFIKECINKIQEIDVVEPAVYIEKVRVDKLDQDVIEKNFVREISESISVKKVLNLVSNIEKETNLTKRTILEILKGCNNFNKYFLNPQVYEERVIKAINECKKNYEVQGIDYIYLDEKYSNDLFKEELTSYIDYILKVNKSVYDSVIIESKIEENFAKSLDQDSRIKLFLKLPDWYIIETPAGNYTPDWAIVVERVQNGVSSEKIYFVVENKGTNEIYELRTDEKIKIESAKKRFSASPVHNLKFIAPIKDFESFKNQW
jgi:type III restriction enzyme